MKKSRVTLRRKEAIRNKHFQKRFLRVAYDSFGHDVLTCFARIIISYKCLNKAIFPTSKDIKRVKLFTKVWVYI